MRKCGRKYKYTIEHMRAHAESKGGKCLSLEYLGPAKNLLWQCACDFQWEAMPVNVFFQRGRKSWCPRCAHRKRAELAAQKAEARRRLRPPEPPQQCCTRVTIEQIRAKAQSRGGYCRSEKYMGSNTKLVFECDCGFQWPSTPRSVLYMESWCPRCANKKRLESNARRFQERRAARHPEPAQA